MPKSFPFPKEKGRGKIAGGGDKAVTGFHREFTFRVWVPYPSVKEARKREANAENCIDRVVIKEPPNKRNISTPRFLKHKVKNGQREIPGAGKSLTGGEKRRQCRDPRVTP